MRGISKTRKYTRGSQLSEKWASPSASHCTVKLKKLFETIQSYLLYLTMPTITRVFNMHILFLN